MLKMPAQLWSVLVIVWKMGQHSFTSFLRRKRSVETSILRILDFSNAFEVACDASNDVIWGLLSQEGHPIVFFRERLNETKKHYSTYDKKIYAIVQTFWYWRY